MVKCFECNNDVDKEIAFRINVSKTDKKSYKYLHNECKENYFKKKEDWLEWDTLYQYVKKEILKYDDKQRLSKHFVGRLQGLRSGNYGFKKNEKVLLSGNGYPYKVILMTFKYKKMDIINAIYNQSKFKDENHKADYIMVIIQNNINDVYLHMKEKEMSDKRVDEIKLINNVEVEFKNKTKLNENKVASKLNHLF